MKLKRIATVLLAVIMPLCLFSQQALATASKNETVYASLNHDGSVDKIYVVNQLIGEYADYGNYTEIKNLSTSSEPVIEGDRIAFPDKDIEGGLYYQGTAQGELPYTFDFSYYLDGAKVTAGELGGASGSLEIKIKGSINEKCDKQLRDGYMAQISLALDMNLVSGIVSDGATTVAAGKTMNVSYTILPGKSAEYSLKADIKDFKMDGISITLLKGTILGIEDTISETEDGFNEMLSGAEDMVDGTHELKDGMTSLSDGLGKLSGGMSKLSSSGGDMLSGMREYSAGLKEYTAGVSGISAASSGIKSGLNELAANASAAANGVSGINSGIKAFYSSSGDLKTLAQSLLSDPDPSVKALAQGTLEALESIGEMSAGLDEASGGVNGFASGVASAAAGYQDFDAGLSEIASNGARLAGGYDEITEGFGSYLSGVKSGAKGIRKIYNSVKGLPDDIQELIDGQIEFKDGISDAKDEILSRTEGFIPDDSAAVSFASPGKNRPSSVQYIMKTPGIDIPETAGEAEPERENETFFTRLADLFK